MGKKRVHEIAKRMGITSNELIEKLKKVDVIVSNHMSMVDEVDIRAVISGVKSTRPKPIAVKKAETLPKAKEVKETKKIEKVKIEKAKKEVIKKAGCRTCKRSQKRNKKRNKESTGQIPRKDNGTRPGTSTGKGN